MPAGLRGIRSAKLSRFDQSQGFAAAGNSRQSPRAGCAADRIRGPGDAPDRIALGVTGDVAVAVDARADTPPGAHR
jgi:hypothetical protein